MTTSNEELGGSAVEKKNLRTGEPIWVQCEGFRCLGILDQRGHWRSFCNRSELLHVLKVLEDPWPE